jgi:hypothetical protein
MHEALSVIAVRVCNKDCLSLESIAENVAQAPQPALIAGWQMMEPLYRRRFLHTSYLASRQSIDQFHEAGIVRITNGRLATWLNPFGMLDPQVVVNLLPKLGVGVDLVSHRHCPGERFKCAAWRNRSGGCESI